MMRTTIRSFLLSVFVFSATAAVDHNPRNNGTTLARNTNGTTIEAALHNPALLGTDRVPKIGCSVPLLLAGVGVWSDKLALSPFNRYWVDSIQEASALTTKILKNSFDLDGLSPEEVSEKLTKEFKDGCRIYSGVKWSLLNFAWHNFAFDISTHFDEELDLPEAPFMILFSETDGLLPGNTLDFSSFKQDGSWSTDFTFSLGLPVSVPFLNDFFKLRYGAGGLGIKYIMGHSILTATTERGEIEYKDGENEISIDGLVKIRTAGLGFSGPWDGIGDIFEDGLPVSGHGFGMDLGGILYDDHGSLSVNFNNIGMLFWTKNVMEVAYTIKKADLDIYDIYQGIDEEDKHGGKAIRYIFNKPSEEISNETDTLSDGSSFTTMLPMTLNIGYSYGWDFTNLSIERQLLAAYTTAAVNYEQALVKTPGRKLVPRISIGGEAGTLNGFLPLRMGFVFGGSEGIASALGAGIQFSHGALNVSYKAIGHPFFVPKRGIELAAGLTLAWGLSNDMDRDSIVDKLDKCRTIPEDRDGFEDADGCPDYDNDRDSVADTVDKCVNIAEDRDGFEDTDGCPDFDNDQDGIADTVDKCPVEAEDKDGFEDNDGCPDTDNDSDKIPDVKDKCPMQPEDFDGFADDDGCPDFDNDADGIADTIDNCMMVPEVFNGYRDEDGCPDTLIRPSEADNKKLVTKLRAINFRTGSAELLPASFTALDFIAGFLKNYATLRYEIQGHTDSQGTDEKNLLLSAARAGTVRVYLLSKGVPEERIIGIGYGETMPVADNTAAAGRAQNRRVEFKIIETNDEYAVLKAREGEFKERVKAAKIKGAK